MCLQEVGPYVRVPLDETEVFIVEGRPFGYHPKRRCYSNLDNHSFGGKHPGLNMRPKHKRNTNIGIGSGIPCRLSAVVTQPNRLLASGSLGEHRLRSTPTLGCGLLIQHWAW